ncbi:MAG TPA: ComEC/Rec2 family competence protein, partial [Candidatus Berkiella sp.]|nr:ComEC/Rec2 family competence protein [Candidatus Berkiella sp.]
LMLILFALGSLLGATLLNFFSTLPQIDYVVYGGISSSLLFICLLTNKLLLKRLSLFLLASIVGFCFAYQHASARLAWSLKPTWWGETLTVTGMVTGISQWHEQTLRFDLAVEALNSELIATTPKIRLFWPRANQWLKEGDKITATVKLQPPWHLANPGNFDQQKQFFIEEIRAVGKLIAIQSIQFFSQKSITRFRLYLNEQMAQILTNKPLLGVIQATTLGLYKNITPRQWQVFQMTGTTHAIAISGLHVSLVALLFGGFVTWVARRVTFLTLLYPAKFYG